MNDKACAAPLPGFVQEDEVLFAVNGKVGCITLNRPRALNALSLGMIRQMTRVLLEWATDDRVAAVALRGQGREEPFGVLCAGGDIRFLYQAAQAGDPRVDDFFTEEYALDYLIHNYPKPYVAFMDGIVMGGGMGVSQGAGLRLVTERTRMAMPETAIGLFPDVGGGYFLSRTPGRVGEYLALTGSTIGAGDAVQIGLADLVVESSTLSAIWDDLADWRWTDAAELRRYLAQHHAATSMMAAASLNHACINQFFDAPDMASLIARLEQSGGDCFGTCSSDWAKDTAAVLRKRSPLLLHVALELIRRGRELSLADDLRLERSLVRRCFTVRPGAQGETVEGIRALVIDKDQSPRWNPARIEDVMPEMVAAYFDPPWPAHAHPLRAMENEFQFLKKSEQVLKGEEG